MNNYDALFIFPDAMKDEALQKALAKIRQEIEKLDGKVDGMKMLGKRTFARPMKGYDEGQYVSLDMSLDPGRMVDLKARLKLNSDIFRYQFVREDEKTVKERPSVVKNQEVKSDGEL